MTITPNSAVTRRSLLGAFAGVSMISAAPVYAGTFGYVKGAGNIRRFHLHNDRTGETIDTLYWIDGQYIRPAMKEINKFMRDWRTGSVANMDPKLIDVIASTHNRLHTSEPFTLLSGYRTSRTNNMLRRKSGGVASKSYHVRAQASDLKLKSRSVSSIARAAMAGRGGGVGKYHRSGFVHVDSGPIRTWNG